MTGNTEHFCDMVPCKDQQLIITQTTHKSQKKKPHNLAVTGVIANWQVDT